MAKIPRISQDSLPSAVPHGAPNLNGVAPIVDAFGGLVDVGYKIAADEEKEHAEKIRTATEQMQAIYNEGEVNLAIGDFSESMTGMIEAVKKGNENTPDAAPDQLLAGGRELMAQHVKNAKNTAVGLGLAQQTAPVLNSAMRDIHAWRLDRQVQMTKGNVDMAINRASAVAETKGSVGALGAHIEDTVARLTPMIRAALGNGAEAKIKEMRAGMALAWVDTRQPGSIIPALAAMKDARPGNPLVDNLNSTQRDTARKGLMAALEAEPRLRDAQAATEAVSSNQKIVGMFERNDPEFLGVVNLQEKTLVTERANIAARIQHDDQALRKLGIETVGGPSPDDAIAMIDSRLKTIGALKNIYRRQMPLDAQDDPTTYAALAKVEGDALKASSNKRLPLIAKLQENLALALDSRQIGGPSASVLHTRMSLALDAAMKSAADPTGPDWFTWWRNADTLGQLEINRQVANRPALRDDPKAQVRIRMDFAKWFNEASKSGKPPTNAEAMDGALGAVAREIKDPAFSDTVWRKARKAGK